jgi:predicted O-methyltransferase YrrM
MGRREDIVSLVSNHDDATCIGVELGVATGQFSKRILMNSRMHLFSIDMWAGDRGHDVEQYKEALRALLPFKERSTVLRMRFDDALELFRDGYFDFVYIDGYAHTGEEEGQTLADWFPKLKAGGLFAGDDYSDRWPKTVKAVDKFVEKFDLELNIHEYEPDNPWDGIPSWWVRKAE